MSNFYDGGQNDEIRLYFIKGGLRLVVWPEGTDRSSGVEEVSSDDGQP